VLLHVVVSILLPKQGHAFVLPHQSAIALVTQQLQPIITNGISKMILRRRDSNPSWSPSQQQRVVTTKSKSTTARSAVVSIDPAVAMASLGATAKLLSSIGLGSWAAQRDILDANAISVLSRLTYWIFQPAFLLTSVCKTLHSAANGGGLSLTLLTLMPLTALIQIGLGNVVGRIVTQTFQIQDPAERRDVTMCTTFANSGPLPLIFSDALFTGAAARGAIQPDVAACISFYLLMWSPLFWSYGKVILGTASLDDKKNVNWKDQVKAQLQLFFSPPVTGAILGLLIGLVAPVRKAFIGGALSPIYGSLVTLGTAYLPAAMLVLAGSLVGKKEISKEPSSSTTTAAAAAAADTGTSLKAILAILLARFCLAPLFAFGVVQTLSKWQLVGPLGSRARAIVTFTLLMEGCMPPAQNSVILLQLEGLRDRATRMAKILTIIYSVAVLPVTILLSACLGLSGILKFV
jgi:predicted permease